MKIKTLKLKNFRCFPDYEIEFHPKCNVLAGMNGKSATLDALSIALNQYLVELNCAKKNPINVEDVYCTAALVGERVESQRQFPSTIGVSGEINEKAVVWEQRLVGENNTIQQSADDILLDYAKRIQNEQASGELPFIAYYHDLGRMWLKQKRKSRKNRKKQFLNRLDGYTDCLNTEHNKDLMIQWFIENAKLTERAVIDRTLTQCFRNLDPSITSVSLEYDLEKNQLIILRCKNDTFEKFPVELLSDGEKYIVSLLADIMYRMILLNPNELEHIWETTGIILIDEVEIHLHPAWQQKIVAILLDIFPNIQFVMATQSSDVLADLPNEYIPKERIRWS